MNNAKANSPPPDQPQRDQALDPDRSILVQAPAGSGKTTLLADRFLRLLAEVDEPGQVVAITFTNAAAAEMRNRILAKLEEAARGLVSGHDFSRAESAAIGARALAPEEHPSRKSPADPPNPPDAVPIDALARRALQHSQALGWKLLDLPAQLRVSTIDSFCRDLALQQPLLSGLGGGLGIAEQSEDLYRRAARQTLEQIDGADVPLSRAIAALLEWRDNSWQEMEDLLVDMLGQRDRWMHGFVLEREPDWEELRQRLERPFANAVQEALTTLDQLLGQIPGGCEEALQLARFACTQTAGERHRELAELAEFPCGPFTGSDTLEEARNAYLCLAALLLTGDGAFRKAVDKRLGFPADRKSEKAHILDLIARLKVIPGLEFALAAVRRLPPARYVEEDWQIVRACFTVLRHAAGQLKVVFADAGAVDFIEVAQIAQNVLKGEDGLPTDAALAVADGIRHLLVDEFQDTSRRQHQLLARLIAAWPDSWPNRNGRTCFMVGDPMQSIYFFRDADAELFPRVRNLGLEIPNSDPFPLAFVQLQANFRTAPPLVDRLNEVFAQIFAADDGSGVTFSPALPARESQAVFNQNFELHLNFEPQITNNKSSNELSDDDKEAARAAQTQEITALIQSHLGHIREARARGDKYRVAVLGRNRTALAPLAQALREAAIPFRAVDLEKLSTRPEVLDAVGLARALLNPQDRVAWLGVLRAPWCGLTLSDLHGLTSADDPQLLARSVPELMAERLPLLGPSLLSPAGRRAVERMLNALAAAPTLRSHQPTASPGTWLEQVWQRLGGADCVDPTERANLDLLWNCLDRLPAGELDLLGPGLDAALEKLTALPDPEAGSDCGIQLMTIHKSKGLEFEVVIVPDLQAGTSRSGRKLLSWLERGLEQPDESGEITEFLIAPLQPKGADRGKAKEWVDRVYRQRESQETRRILYVAATRAREELHLFARPAYKVESDGSLTLPEPTNSLLATAWPALEGEVRARFEDWKSARANAAPAEQQVVESIAASEASNSEASNLLIMSAPLKPTLLRRLPPGYEPAPAEASTASAAESLRAPSFRLFSGERVGNHEPQPAVSSSEPEMPDAPGLASETWETTLYPRHNGGQLSRALGSAVHTLLEELARLRITLAWESARTALKRIEPRIAAQVRATGVDQTQATKIAAQAMESALSASHSPQGQWILSPHTQSASEVRWAGVVAGGLHTVRVDRVFQAGPAPLSEGEDSWWIVDYKTAHADTLAPDAALPELRQLFAPQIEAYAQVLRNLHGDGTPIRAGLYYPRMLLLDWWEL